MIEGPELSLSGPQDFINRFVPSLPPASCLLSGFRHHRSRAHRTTARTQVVPVHDRVEAEDVGAVRLPAPIRANTEAHHVPCSDRRINELRAASERSPAHEHTRQQHLRRVGRKAQYHARRRIRGSVSSCGTTTATTTATAATTTGTSFGSTGRSCWGASARSTTTTASTTTTTTTAGGRLTKPRTT